jgi:hypothetical protein
MFIEACAYTRNCQTYPNKVGVKFKEVTVGIRYQATPSEDMEDIMCAIVRRQVCELVRAL